MKQPQKLPRNERRKLTTILSTAFLALASSTLFSIALINWLFFPMCSRVTGDCFLIQYLWV